MEKNNLEHYNQHLEIYYFRVTDIWKKLCEEHTTLLDQACQEYTFLLGNKLDELEDKVSNKKETIGRINLLEKSREKIIIELNSFLIKYNTHSINSISELISLMGDFESLQNQKHLFRFNELLIDIIIKIQTQNKKNQLFINRALLNLKSIREDAMGEKSYSTYNSSGGEKSKSISF